MQLAGAALTPDPCAVKARNAAFLLPQLRKAGIAALTPRPPFPAYRGSPVPPLTAGALQGEGEKNMLWLPQE